MKKFLGGSILVLMFFALISNGAVGFNNGEINVNLPKSGMVIFTKLGEIINVMLADTKKEPNSTPLRKSQ